MDKNPFKRQLVLKASTLPSQPDLLSLEQAGSLQERSHKGLQDYSPLFGMVWYGMVWYGMVWYGMVWYGMVWYGMVWYGMVWYGMVWYDMEWYGMAAPLVRFHVGFPECSAANVTARARTCHSPKLQPPRRSSFFN